MVDLVAEANSEGYLIGVGVVFNPSLSGGWQQNNARFSFSKF